MSRKLIRPITIQNTRLVIVDSLNWHGRKVYRAFKTIDEKTEDLVLVRAVYEHGRYVDVDEIEGIESEDEKDKVEFKNFDINPKLKKASKEQVSNLRKEQIDNFLWLNSHIKEKLPIGRIITLIKRVPIKVFDKKYADSEDATMRGYFDREETFIAFVKSELGNKDRRARISRFHEFIHYIQHMLSKNPDEILNDIMTEAQTESLAISRDEAKRSRAVIFKQTSKPTMAIFNYPADCYPFAVALLRQMEAIMGRKSYDKHFESDREFPEEFTKKYGKDLYTFIYARMNALEFEKNDEIEANKEFYFSEAQDKLMKEAFRQDYNKMKTIEDAKDILTRLRELEKQRADLYVKEGPGNIKPIGHYEEFYDSLYKRIGNRLLKLGYSKEKILTELEEFKYEPQEFYPILSEEIFVEQMTKKLEKSVIKRFQAEEQQPFNSDKHKIVYSICRNGDYAIGVSDRKSGRLISLRFVAGDISVFTGTEDFAITQELLDQLESPEAPELRLPKRLYSKYRRNAKLPTNRNVEREE